MAQKARVPQWQQPRQFVEVEPGATKGATIGVNVYNADGTLYAPAVAASDTVQFPVTLWRQIREVPPNVVALEHALGSTGLFAVTDAGEGALRTLQGPMSVAVVNGDGVAGDPSLALVGDVAAPGALFAYGTNAAGAKGWYRPALFESTGLLDGGVLSINAGDPTKFDVTAAVVGYTDYITNPAQPTRIPAVYGPTSANAVPNLAVIATYVGIQTPGLTLAMQSSPFTPTQRRTIVPLGAVISNGVQLIAVNNLPDVMRAGINQLQDLMEAIGPIRKPGNVISANGATLQINKSAGVIFKQGANFANNEEDPHNLSLPALTPATFAYRTSTGVQSATTNAINVTQYESPLGTLALVGNNRFTIQRIYVFASNLIRIQYGQHEYQTLADAEAALTTETFATEQNIADNGVLLAFLIVEKGATALNDPAQAKFIPASKFGGPVGSGGTSITTTDALPEGLINLYFTDERAQDAVGSILANSADIEFTYSDAVPSISALLSAGVHASLLLADTSVQPSRAVNTGTGLLGGGTLAIDRTLTLDLAYTDARYPVLTGGKINPSALPAVAITETFVVASQAAMLALTAQTGDVAVRTDQSKSYILVTEPASTLANWQELLTPASPVSSVFGRVGAVSAQPGDYTFAQIGATPTTVQGYGITNAVRTDTSNLLPAAAVDWRISGNSPAGADVLNMRFVAGGAFSAARGAILELSGANAATNPGGFRLLGGAASTVDAGVGTLALRGTGGITVTGATDFVNDVTFFGGGACARFHNNGSDLVFVEFYRDSAAPAARSAYIGYGSAGTTELTIENQIAAGSVSTRVAGVTVMSVNADGTLTVGNGTVGGIQINRTSTTQAPFIRFTSSGVGHGQVRGVMSGGVPAGIAITNEVGNITWAQFDLAGRALLPLIHNNVSGAAGTTPMVASGTYTPTLTNVANLDSSTSAECQWMRVGNVVHVTGVITVDPTAGTTAAPVTTTLRMALPVASAMTLIEDLGGAGAGSVSTGNESVTIAADTATDTATLNWRSTTPGSHSVTFAFSYLVK